MIEMKFGLFHPESFQYISRIFFLSHKVLGGENDTIFVLERGDVPKTWVLNEYVASENTMILLDVSFPANSDLYEVSEMLNTLLKQSEEGEKRYIIELDLVAEAEGLLFNRKTMECEVMDPDELETPSPVFTVPSCFDTRCYTVIPQSTYNKLMKNDDNSMDLMRIPFAVESLRIVKEMVDNKRYANVKLMERMISAVEEARKSGLYQAMVINNFDLLPNSKAVIEGFLNAGYDITLNDCDFDFSAYEICISWLAAEDRRVGEFIDNTGK